MVVLLPEKRGFGPKIYSICSQLYHDKPNQLSVTVKND